MRVVVQRVSSARVRVAGDTVGEIGRGLVLLVGVDREDSEEDVAAAIDKIAHLRVFADQHGRMNLALRDVGGAVLLISQFTLVGDARRGRRPSFTRAADPVHAARLIDSMADGIRALGIETHQGRFGAHMAVDLVNDGPVTFTLDVSRGHVV